MNLSRRNIIIVATALAALIIIVVLVIWLGGDKQKIDKAPEPQIYDNNNISEQASVIGAINEVDEQLDGVKAVARNFVERYLSFSNQNWGENIEALEVKMTEGMIQRSQQDLLQWKSQYLDDEFYGVSVKVLSQPVLLATDSSYSLSSSVQMEETIGSSTQIVYKNYEVELVKAGDGWLVDNLSLVD